MRLKYTFGLQFLSLFMVLLASQGALANRCGDQIQKRSTSQEVIFPEVGSLVVISSQYTPGGPLQKRTGFFGGLGHTKASFLLHAQFYLTSQTTAVRPVANHELLVVEGYDPNFPEYLRTFSGTFEGLSADGKMIKLGKKWITANRFNPMRVPEIGERVEFMYYRADRGLFTGVRGIYKGTERGGRVIKVDGTRYYYRNVDKFKILSAEASDL